MSSRREESSIRESLLRSWSIGIQEAMSRWEDRHILTSMSLWDNHKIRLTREWAKFSRLKVLEVQETPILCNLTTKISIQDPSILEVLVDRTSSLLSTILTQTALKEVKTLLWEDQTITWDQVLTRMVEEKWMWDSPPMSNNRIKEYLTEKPRKLTTVLSARRMQTKWHHPKHWIRVEFQCWTNDQTEILYSSEEQV